MATASAPQVVARLKTTRVIWRDPQGLARQDSQPLARGDQPLQLRYLARSVRTRRMPTLGIERIQIVLLYPEEAACLYRAPPRGK